MRDMGIRVIMLTGDNERTAKAIGAQAGVDEVIAGVLPEGKEAEIRKLKEQGQSSHGRRRNQRCPGTDTEQIPESPSVPEPMWQSMRHPLSWLRAVCGMFRRPSA